MSQTTILRVGICACVPFWHGKLAGRTFTVTQMTEYHYFSTHIMTDIARPRTFEIQEVAIPERSHHGPLKKGRCHFFVDTHQLDGKYGRRLVPGLTARGDIYYETIIGQCYIIKYQAIEHYNITGLHDEQSRVYRRKKVPGPGELVSAIADLIMDMQEQSLDYWLSAMQAAQ